MSMINEIYRAFFVALGVFEITSNLTYLTKADGIEKARNQHQEIPSDVSDQQMKQKVIDMFVSGILFLAVGLFSYITHEFQACASCIVLTLFSVYALSEALYYRYIRTFCMFAISAVVTCICFLAN